VGHDSPRNSFVELTAGNRAGGSLESPVVTPRGTSVFPLTPERGRGPAVARYDGRYSCLELQTHAIRFSLLLLRALIGLGQGFAYGCVVANEQTAVVDTLPAGV